MNRNGQSAAKLLKDIIASYEERSTTMPRKGSRLSKIIAETPDINTYNLFTKTPFNKKHISCIYAIITLDKERLYIGSTKSIVKRMQKHRNLLRCNCHHSTYMQRCYNKGIELYYLIIEETIDLERKELFWINLLSPEFNSTDDTRSNFRKSTFINDYTIPNAIKLRKKVNVYTKDGIFIESFDSITDAAKAYNTSRSNIKLSCNTLNRSCKGHVFRFNNIFEYTKPKIGVQNISLKNKLISIHSKPIRRSDGVTYNSISEAEKLNGLAHNTLGFYIKNKRRLNGYIYEYIV